MLVLDQNQSVEVAMKLSVILKTTTSMTQNEMKSPLKLRAADTEDWGRPAASIDATWAWRVY